LPVFLDVHKISQIGDTIGTPTIEDEEFRVTRINTFHNIEVDLIYYLLDATRKQVIEKYHSKFNFKCDSIT
jgi:hypothetical protein